MKYTNYRFETYSYDPKKRELQKTNAINNTNTIYCRNIEFINIRIKEGPKVIVLGVEY